MIKNMVTWTVPNNMEEEEGVTEAGVRESGVQYLQSGRGEWRSHQLP